MSSDDGEGIDRMIPTLTPERIAQLRKNAEDTVHDYEGWPVGMPQQQGGEGWAWACSAEQQFEQAKELLALLNMSERTNGVNTKQIHVGVEIGQTLLEAVEAAPAGADVHADGKYIDGIRVTDDVWALLVTAPPPPHRDTAKYALAAHSTLERELVRALHEARELLAESVVVAATMATHDLDEKTSDPLDVQVFVDEVTVLARTRLAEKRERR